ncbi:ComF family protein [Piscinibacter aquaticus]|uniref:ComF family protein n=1 Tax=Piscinibacter aquaticus TaxID=392597 RepID=A0A5C6U3K2_9BURK|nr:ComF family protein [Piscinibacter aquaticus]
MSIASMLQALPGQCSLCRSWGAGHSARHAGALVARRPRCLRCAIAVPAGETICGACLRQPPPFERTVAVLDYAAPWDGLIRHFKFHGQPELAAPLAALLREAIEAAADPMSPDLVLPAPLSDARLRERGFNQSWEIARRLGWRADPALLLRIRDTPHQADLPLDRRAANVRSVFAVEPLRRREVDGRSIAVVDDVLTTGATASEMARTLRDAGAARVALWVIARTPAPGGS